jgi:hypothetical protein
MILRVAWFVRVGHAWRAGRANVERGLAITRRQPELYLELALLYSLPSLVAAGLVVFGPHETPWYAPLVFVLPCITAIVAPVAVMHAVDAGRAGEQISVVEATRRGVPWVPRYLWTNVHTTALFWVPVGALLLLRSFSPLGSLVPSAIWIGVIGIVAVHQHVRTVLAPYLAVHGDLGGTHAALASWQLGGQHFWRLLGTFAIGSAPVAVPLLLAYGLAARFGPLPLSAALVAASAQLGWVGVNSVRPVLIPALHVLYEEICAEQGLPGAGAGGEAFPAADARAEV